MDQNLIGSKGHVQDGTKRFMNTVRVVVSTTTEPLRRSNSYLKRDRLTDKQRILQDYNMIGRDLFKSLKRYEKDKYGRETIR